MKNEDLEIAWRAIRGEITWRKASELLGKSSAGVYQHICSLLRKDHESR